MKPTGPASTCDTLERLIETVGRVVIHPATGMSQKDDARRVTDLVMKAEAEMFSVVERFSRVRVGAVVGFDGKFLVVETISRGVVDDGSGC